MCTPIALASFKQHTHLKHERSEVFELMVQIGELLKHRLCPETGQDGRVASPPTTKSITQKQTQIKWRILRTPLASSEADPKHREKVTAYFGIDERTRALSCNGGKNGKQGGGWR